MDGHVKYWIYDGAQADAAEILDYEGIPFDLEGENIISVPVEYADIAADHLAYGDFDFDEHERTED